MKKLILLTTVLLCVAMQTSLASIIGTKDLATELKANKDLVVIDVLAADVYSKQHVKGAINIPHKDLYKQGGYEGQLKTPEELAKIFGDKGVSNVSKIVIYDDGSQKYNSRVWWILTYLGAKEVYLLHKDMTELEQSRIPLTNVATVLKPVSFVLNVNESINISMTELKSSIGQSGFVMLDAREKEEFDGMDKEKRSKGHLPGAVWMNFKEVLTPTGDFKTKEEIIAVAAKFGVSADKSVVVYCQTGIKAATLYVALHEIAGFSNIRLYAGAYAEWVANPENTIEK
ncbi:MAG: sulfurtransferase [Bacteroidales bacterium]|nr:sulfurtransferase [Bacteroidales bacterium]